jgi:predicted alpha/beta-hydrolase family hydrolase
MSSSRSIRLPVSDVVGTVSGEYLFSAAPSCIMTLAHGAGAGMDHSFMVELAAMLAAVDIATLRFNFPFTEHKKFRPDSPAVAHATIAAAITHARETFPTLPFFAAGKSFGGRMTSQYLSLDPRPEVRGLVFYGFPLHAAGKPSIDRAEHLKNIKTPKLFLQGTKDELASWDLIYSVCSGLAKTRLVRLDGVNHAFKAGKRDILSLLVRATEEWMGGGNKKALCDAEGLRDR